MAMWTGYLIASYSTVANDSIQTIGTFIAANKNVEWYFKWIWITSIFLITITYSWVVYDGDISF